MSDPLRTDPSRQSEIAPGVERDARIEDLLLSGLDHYIGGRYEHAINVWTRVLFLDRSHARARAYIERARSALAEQLRESEELLHGGVAAFDRGEIDAARRLLNSALERGGPNEVALALLARLNRLELVVETRLEPSRTSVPRRPSERFEETRSRPRTKRLWLMLGASGLVVAAGIVWLNRPVLVPALGHALQRATAPQPGTTKQAEDSLPLPRSSTGILARARVMESGGRLTDALRLLDHVRPTDPARAEADRLKTEIQSRLLSTVRVDPRPTEPSPVDSTSEVSVPDHE